MVAVKKQTKVKTGTVVKIDLDDAGMLRVTTGNMTQIDSDDEDDYETLPTYQPTEIVYGGKKYVLREPLQCKVVREGTTFGVEYDPLGIWGAGDTMEEAIDFFCYQFADTYEWLNELHDHKGEQGVPGIGENLENVRQLINKLVIHVA
jgi:hypothetical protein